LQVGYDENEPRPRPVGVGFGIPGGDLAEVTAEFGQGLVGEPQRGPGHVHVPATASLLGLKRRGDIYGGGFQHGPEECSGLLRAGVVAGRLGFRRSVDSLDLASGQSPVLGDIDESGLLELAEVVVEPVRG
jgi:hypothetical protein